jgi:hypothetical protein
MNSAQKLTDMERHNYAVIGKAQREHLTNAVKILAATQRLVGHSLMAHAIQSTALQGLEDAEDWQIGLAYVDLVLSGEAQMANTPGMATIQ